MKKTVSVVLAFALLISVFSNGISAFADSKPYMLEKSHSGKLLVSVSTYATTRTNRSPFETSSTGRKITLKRGKKFSIIGKDKKHGSDVYIRYKLNNKTYYSYINRYNVSVDNSENAKTEKLYNAYYKKNMFYPYEVYKDMNIYQFNQTKKSGSINGLRISYSCGPHSLACVLSALSGKIVTPESIMKHMSRRYVNSRGNGSKVAGVAQSVKPYIKEHYKLNYDFKVISPYDAFDYVKNGYFVIVGVENLDGLSLFTRWSHYITLIGYDETGNILTANSNLRTDLFESFSKARIKRNMKNSKFYRENTIAFKYKYDDSYYEYKNSIKTTVVKETQISQHKNGKGRLINAAAGKKITVLGSKGNNYYIRYKKNGEEAFGFINKDSTANTVYVSSKKTAFVYDTKPKKPILHLKNALGKNIPESEYKIIYPEESTEIGRYTVKIKYSEKYSGKRTFEYTILPPKTSLVSVNTKRTIATVKWKDENNSIISKYQTEYSEDKKFEKGVKKITVDKEEKQVKIEKLKSKRKYYFRIRSYKYKNGERFYSDYSNVKSAQTKK